MTYLYILTDRSVNASSPESKWGEEEREDGEDGEGGRWEDGEGVEDLHFLVSLNSIRRVGKILPTLPVDSVLTLLFCLFEMNQVLLLFSIWVCVSLAILPSAKAFFLKNYRLEASEKRETTFKDSEGRSHQSFSASETFDISGSLIAQMPEDTGSYRARVIQRDYAIDNPLPKTGQTTILNLITNLNPSQIFAPCPENSQLIEFAESTNFLVQICLKQVEQDSQVFWMGYAKDGRGSLTVRIDDNFEFWNVDTYYAIERRPLGENSYLLIGWPNGNLDAEALMYYYYPCFGECIN